MKSSHGGKRSGAGKPRGTQWPTTAKKEEVRELTRTLITGHIREMVEAQIKKAKGVRFLVTRDAKRQKFVPVTKHMLKHGLAVGEVLEVWEKAPDTGAFNALCDRAMDRAAQPVAVDGKLRLQTATMTDEELLGVVREIMDKCRA